MRYRGGVRTRNVGDSPAHVHNTELWYEGWFGDRPRIPLSTEFEYCVKCEGKNLTDAGTAQEVRAA